MSEKLNIGQIYIPNHKQAANFVSLYQETVRTDQPVNLFLIVEIKGDKKFLSPKKREEFEKVTQSLVRALKGAYISERIVTEATFEQALTAINNDLSTLARNGVVGWYKRLNALVAAYSLGQLHLSATGTMSGLLLRGGEYSQISESLSPGAKPHPLKTFLNFASGTLTQNDHVILTTSGIYNYVSLEKLRRTLKETELSQASRELVKTLKTDMSPHDSFAGFVCEIKSQLRLSDTELHPLISPAGHNIIEDRETLNLTSVERAKKISGQILAISLRLAQWIMRTLSSGLRWLYNRARSTKLKPAAAAQITSDRKHPSTNHSKRNAYLIALSLVIFLLIANLIFSNFRNAQKKTEGELKQKLQTATLAVTNAEAALIYNDQNKALAELASAQENLEPVAKDSAFKNDVQRLREKIDKLTNQLNKVATIAHVDALGSFTQTPDRLIKLPDGFLGFNTYTDSFEKLKLPEAQVSQISLTSPVPENLATGLYFTSFKAPVFLGTGSGRFYQLQDTSRALTPLFATSTAQNSPLYTLVGASAYQDRVYTIDKQAQQIYRISAVKGWFGSLEPWLKQAADLSQARDIAVDGNIFILTANSVLKFTQGKPQSFSLPTLTTAVTDAKTIHTEKDAQYIYITDPGNSRIVVVTKQGGLQAQFKNEKFSNLKDIWVDEANKTVYTLIGNEVGKFKY